MLYHIQLYIHAIECFKWAARGDINLGRVSFRICRSMSAQPEQDVRVPSGQLLRATRGRRWTLDAWAIEIITPERAHHSSRPHANAGRLDKCSSVLRRPRPRPQRSTKLLIRPLHKRKHLTLLCARHASWCVFSACAAALRTHGALDDTGFCRTAGVCADVLETLLDTRAHQQLDRNEPAAPLLEVNAYGCRTRMRSACKMTMVSRFAGVPRDRKSIACVRAVRVYSTAAQN